MNQVIRKSKTGALLGKVAVTAENAFLALLVLYLVYLYSFNSTYYFFTPLTWARILLFLMAGVGAVKTGASMYAVGKWNWKLIPALLLSFLYIGVYYTNKSIFFLFLPVLTVTFIDIDYRKVVKVAAVMGLAFLTASYIGVFSGVIDNLVYYRDGYIRSSWGFGYPTDMASFLFFIIGMVWIAWRELPDELVLLASIFCLWISYAYAASRTSIACCVFFMFIIIYHMIETRILQPNQLARHISSVFQKIATYAFPIMALFFGCCLLLYAKKHSIGLQLNALLSERLAYTLRIWQDIGIHPFGSKIDILGNGGNLISPDSNYFLDCSYAMILLQYGWPLLFALGVLWCRMSYCARQKGDLRLLLMMAMISIHAFSEQHFTEVMYNILLPLLFAAIPEKTAMERESEPTVIGYWKQRKAILISAMVSSIAICLIAPIQLSRIRTILDICGYAGERWEKCQFLLQLFLLLLLIVFPVFSITTCFLNKKNKSQNSIKRISIVCTLCIAFLFGIYLRETQFIHNGERNFSSMVEADYDTINTITETAEGKVCVESVPELYKTQFETISRPILYGDDLARLKCGTVITNLGVDRQRFTDMGFFFTPISNYHAIYSNDPAVIAALEANGFLWTDYYSATFEIDLKSMAEMNDMELTSEGTILLSGFDDSLNEGPGLDIYSGTYALRTELKIPVDIADRDDLVCTLQITDFYEGNLLQENKIMRSDFDQNGRLILNTSFYTRKGSRNVEFHFIPANDQQIEILHIQYQKLSN